ncbi:3'(2'),5'-bisphosphate nucleotidase CysQ family protein [Terrarubrum flagellatum]|uniref:3'(2'),5'-bisphosphate nucleotidase CysQ family protein n=1 Tax=Terrirubrum flagellatum TaxID=2895980 RepID=UPI0031451ABD
MMRADPALLDAFAGLAAEAGRILLETPRRAGMTAKPDGSPVTAADIACEKAMARRISALLPGVPIIGEESAPEGCRLPEGGRLILLDPLDGTRAFIDGRDDFCICLALVEGGEPVLGVLGAPARGMVYAGLAGSAPLCWAAKVGANGVLAAERTALKVRTGRRPPIGLVSERHGDPASEAILERVGAVERPSLSSALKFAALAEGKADLYPRLAPTMGWDTAAGQAVLAAAGGATYGASGAILRYDAGQPLLNAGFVAVGDMALRATIFG